MAAYIDGGVEIEGRVRSHLGIYHKDLSSERLLGWINQMKTESQRVAIWLPTSTDSATAATVAIETNGSGQSQILRIALSRTIGSPSVSYITFSPEKTVGDVIEAIRLLELGWSIALINGGDEEEVSTTDCWRSELVATGSIADAKAINLATVTATSAYGDREDALELRFYQPWAVVHHALTMAGAPESLIRYAGTRMDVGGIRAA